MPSPTPLLPVGLLIGLALAGCGFGRSDADLLERERLKFGATNDLRALEELRRQLTREEEIVEIYLSELDRAREVQKQLQRRIDQQRGQVTVLETNARTEKEKAEGLTARVQEARQQVAALEAELAALTKSLQDLAARREQLREQEESAGDQPAMAGADQPGKGGPPPDPKGSAENGTPEPGPEKDPTSAGGGDGRS